MTLSRTLAVALLASATLATALPANALVPGSETYERARENADIQSVITGSASQNASPFAGEARTFGYATAAPSGGLVPGSDYYDDAADADSINSVVTGTPEGAEGVVQSRPAGRGGRLVPGSDSF